MVSYFSFKMDEEVLLAFGDANKSSRKMKMAAQEDQFILKGTIFQLSLQYCFPANMRIQVCNVIQYSLDGSWMVFDANHSQHLAYLNVYSIKKQPGEGLFT